MTDPIPLAERCPWGAAGGRCLRAPEHEGRHLTAPEVATWPTGWSSYEELDEWITRERQRDPSRPQCAWWTSRTAAPVDRAVVGPCRHLEDHDGDHVTTQGWAVLSQGGPCSAPPCALGPCALPRGHEGSHHTKDGRAWWHYALEAKGDAWPIG